MTELFWLGMDFSTLEETEALGGVFFQDGVAGDLPKLLKASGVNAARLRLWVNPYAPDGAPYGGGTSDLPRLVRLAKRAKANGMRFLLDLHYSDFWCDPGRQLPPKGWEKLSFPALCDRVYAYTAEVLAELRREGVTPDWVQVGNEITNGMLFPFGALREEGDGSRTGYAELSLLLNAGCRAVRDACDARIVLHLENSGNNVIWRQWLDAVTARGVEFDIIGASYYPFWHGSMAGLGANLEDVSQRYGKDVAVVETSYAFTTETPDASCAPLVISDPVRCFDGSPAPYPLTREGQRCFVRDILACVASLPRGIGVFYWEPGWLPVPGSTWATEAARQYMHETDKPGGNEWANQCLFDYAGNANPALSEFAAFAAKHNGI